MVWWVYEYTAISVSQAAPTVFTIDTFFRGPINTGGAMAEVEHMIRKTDNMPYHRVGEILAPWAKAQVSEKQFKDFAAYVNSVYLTRSRMQSGTSIKLAIDAVEANLNGIISAFHAKYKQLECAFLDDRDGKRYEVLLRPAPPEPEPPEPPEGAASARF